MTTLDPPTLLAKLNKLPLQDLSSEPEARKQALELSKKLTASLEDPFNRAIELSFSPLVVAGARIAIDLDIFNLLAKHDSPLSAEKVAEKSGGQTLLVYRLLRLLAAVGLVSEEAEGLWAATPLTHAMASQPIAAGHRMIWEVITTSVVTAPKFFRERGHISPGNPKDGLVQYAHQTDQDVFGFMNTNPDLPKDFNSFMGNTTGNRVYWYDWFPVKEQLLDGLDDTTSLLVDVGGGRGHDIQAFQAKFPNSGQLVLQDLPQVIEKIDGGSLGAPVQMMQHDFFAEQPVKAARAYFLHHILHDWPDGHCLRILKQLRHAIKPGYSKLLIHELILPEVGATPHQCIYDMAMMTCNSAMGRSRSQWTSLLSQAGFNIVKFWVDDEDADGIVEAVVKA